MLIRCKNISKSYVMGNIKVDALKNINFTIEEGTSTAVVGPSGSGKSTLMNILGCLDTPTAGTYFLSDIDISSLGRNKLSFIRNKKIGFIFQNFNLLPRYNVYHNVELPLIYSGLSSRERKRRVHKAIEMVGLADRLRHKPNELSGGQKQRVAIARALVNRPSIILADEPTGNLDTATGMEIMEIFNRLVKRGNTIIVVTHDKRIARTSGKKITIIDGSIHTDSISTDDTTTGTICTDEICKEQEKV
jgi:putative ABC transport system ATP-binding protein